MTAIQRFRTALQESQLDMNAQARILQGHEKLTDHVSKERHAAFFVEIIERMDAELDLETRRDIRDACPCPVFQGQEPKGPVFLTYCYCCAGHFRFHYQIALDWKLVTRAVVSSALASLGAEP